MDYRRLGKQRVETKQILRALDGQTKGWVNHPATRMWRGYEYALTHYGLAICKEWTDRGYNDTLTDFFIEEARKAIVQKKNSVGLPKWLGQPDFHLSHQSNLVRKAPEYYGLLFPGVQDDLPYIWPTEEKSIIKV